MRSFFYFCSMESKTKSNFKVWLKKVGIAGFLFFLIKGIVWLVIGYFIMK